jgi:adenylate cyclase class 2
VYEVEQKYPVADIKPLEARLMGMGATWHGSVEQVDRYFNHPSRDFAATDEALRLRSTGDGMAITWKGPRLAASAKTRREIELPLIEAAVPAAAGVEAAVPAAAGVEAAVLAAAGVEAVVPAAAGVEAAVLATAGVEAAVGESTRDEASSRSRVALDRWTELLEALGFRRVREVVKRRRSATVAWDGAEIEVALDHVTGLGDFVELEVLAEADGLAAASRRVESLARQLGCTNPERRSYLEMLLAAP